MPIKEISGTPNKGLIMAGYSKTPLVKKLGLKEGFAIKLYNQPDYYFDLLEDMPPGILHLKQGDKIPADFIHYFALDLGLFLTDLPKLQKQITQDGMIWISWDKTLSKKEGAVNGDIVRQKALSLDLVDIKVCAVDDRWSGLKLVIRKERRKKQDGK